MNNNEFRTVQRIQCLERGFLSKKDNRRRHNVKVLAYDHKESNKNKVLAVLEIPSIKTIQKMLKDPETIKMIENAGVIVET